MVKYIILLYNYVCFDKSEKYIRDHSINITFRTFPRLFPETTLIIILLKLFYFFIDCFYLFIYLLHISDVTNAKWFIVKLTPYMLYIVV